MSTLMKARGLVKAYGSRTVVKGIDLSIDAREVVAVIGPNGSGKSTTVEMILGLRRPDGGEVTFDWSDPRRHTGIQLQTTPFFPGLTVAENLRIFAAFYGQRLLTADIGLVLQQCGLAEVPNVDATKLSGGQQKRLAIAVALVHSPQLVFLDEPTAALDPLARHEIRQLIRRLADAGTAVLFTSHDMEEVAKLADRVVLLYDGRIRAEGAPQDLLAAQGVADLEELYLALTTTA